MNRLQWLTISLCAATLLNEVGTAHPRHSLSVKRKIVHKKENRELVHDDGHKRFTLPSGALLTLLKHGYKALKLSSQYFSDITSVVSVISTIYAEIDDCKRGKYAIVDTWMKEAEETTNFINTNSHKINEMQLEIKDMQILVESLNYIYNLTIAEMEQVGGLSEKLLTVIDTKLPEMINKSVAEVETLAKEAEKKEEEVDYAEITGDVIDKIDQSLNFAVPVVSVVVPRLPKALAFAKKRLGNFKVSGVFSRLKNLKIKLPPINSKALNAMKSWFSKTSTYIKGKLGTLRTILTNRYSRALKIANGIKKGIFILTGYVGGAFNIYSAVQNFRKCELVKEQTWNALQKIREAKKTYDELWANVTNAKALMNTAKRQMYKRVSDEIFLADLLNTKETLVALQGEKKGLQDMIDTVAVYINNVQNTTDITNVYNMLLDLYEKTLGTLPFVYRCLLDKAGFVRAVVDTCKKGDKDMEYAIEFSRNLFNYQLKECAKKIEVDELKNEELIKATTKASEREGFSLECPLNNKGNIDKICRDFCSGSSPTSIARDLSVKSVKLVESEIEKCPPCPITDVMKKMICFYKKDKGTIEDIKDFFPMLHIAQIQKVFDSCPN